MNQCKTPQTSTEFAAYFDFRWQLLRKPWGQVQGSEQDELENQSIHRMIVNDNNEVIGVGRLHKTDQYQAQIRFMAVDDNYQGQGLGKKLVQVLEVEASRLGVKTISLKARESAIKFYQNLGYQLEGFSHLLYDEIKHFSMSKSIKLSAEHQACQVEQLQQTWHQTIPLSKAMNIEISYYDNKTLLTHCDTAFNKNLHQTMFAGSIYTLATLTGWGWVYLQLQQQNIAGDIVLAQADIRYHSPIEGASCAMTSVDLVTGEVSELNKNKKAKLSITVQLYSGDKLAATFSGQYVVIAK